MNTLEWAVRDGVPYAIDFMNPAPDMDINSLTPTYFEWVVKHMADMAIELAQKPRPQAKELQWSTAVLTAARCLTQRLSTSDANRVGPHATTRSPRYHDLLDDDQLAADSQRDGSTTSSRRRGLRLRRPAALHRPPAAVPDARAVPVAPASASRARCCRRSTRRYERRHGRPRVPRAVRAARLGGDARSRSIPASAIPAPTSRLDAFFVADDGS